MQEQKQRSSQKEEEDKVDFESFIGTQEDYNTEIRHGGKGTARLKKCRLVDSEEISKYSSRRRNRHTDKYVEFEATLTNTDKNIIIRHPASDMDRDLNRVLRWTNASDIKDLAGKRAPIRHVKDNYYTFESFTGAVGPSLGYLSIDIVKKMAENGLLKFRGGRWVTRGPIEYLSTLALPFSFGAIAYLLSVFPTSVILMISMTLIMSYLFVSPVRMSN